MPIEIRELVIRARVDAGGGQGGTSCGRPAPRPGPRNREQSGAADNDVVQACVREVMRILEEKRER